MASPSTKTINLEYCRVRMNIWYRPPSESQPPVARDAVCAISSEINIVCADWVHDDQLHTLGFSCYAIECVQAPEGMRNYLEKELALNRIVSVQRRGVSTPRI